MMRRKLLGAFGEATAADYLRRRGYEILGMNYRCRQGELDIIARKNGVYVFVEVKLRREGGYAPAAEYVTAEKQRKLRLAAASWLEDSELDEPECRFDVIEVYLDKEGKKLTRLNHMKEAF